MYRAFALGLICVTVCVVPVPSRAQELPSADVHLSGWLFGGEFSL
jgi:hypothetical protein